MDVVRVNPLHGVTRAEKAFFIKCLCRSLLSAPIARCDVGATVADFCLVAHGNELELQPGGGQAEVTGFGVRCCDEQAKRAGFGHAQPRGHHHAFAVFLFGCRVEAVPDGLSQRGTGIEQLAHAAQKIAAQFRVGLHGIGYRLKPDRHIEIPGGRHLAQVAQGLAQQGRCGLAVVNVQRAAVEYHHEEVVVASGRVVPRHPVHQHQRVFGNHRH